MLRYKYLWKSGRTRQDGEMVDKFPSYCIKRLVDWSSLPNHYNNLFVLSGILNYIQTNYY